MLPNTLYRDIPVRCADSGSVPHYLGQVVTRVADSRFGPIYPSLKLSKAANTRVFIVYNDREKLLFSPVLTFEQRFDILVFIVVYEVR
jgi:hypothetical protein